jgi:hypothetical protein
LALAQSALSVLFSRQPGCRLKFIVAFAFPDLPAGARKAHETPNRGTATLESAQ